MAFRGNPLPILVFSIFKSIVNQFIHQISISFEILNVFQVVINSISELQKVVSIESKFISSLDQLIGPTRELTSQSTDILLDNEIIFVDIDWYYIIFPLITTEFIAFLVYLSDHRQDGSRRRTYAISPKKIKKANLENTWNTASN